jgi:hypothetical protein
MVKNILNGYKISDSGILYSKRLKRPMAHFKDRDGYIKSHYSMNGKTKQVLVHRLVAKTFIKNPNNFPQVHHINNKRDDNRVENLEWISPKENIARIRNITCICPNCNFKFKP